MATSVYLGEHFERRMASLDATLERSRADAKAGRAKPADEVFDRLEAKYARMAEERENQERGDL